MAISVPGVGSNLDVNALITQLMAAERRPLVALAKKEASYQAKLSAYGTLKASLASFQSAVQGLSSLSKFQSLTATASDTAVLTATASSNATPGTYAVEVSQLAQAQKLVAVGQASTSTAIGNGTISFDFGTINIGNGSFDSATGKYIPGTTTSFTSNGAGIKNVTIDASNNSLSGIRDAINNAKIGVTATIVNDGGASPYRLALTVDASGKSNSLKISVAGDSALSTLLNHDPAGSQALSETMTARNAEFKVDGIAVSKTSNSVTDVIQGVTLNLARTNIGSPAKVVVAHDALTVKASVNLFVKAYNDIDQSLKDLSAYNPATKQGAVLNGDSAVRLIQTGIRAALTTPITGNGGSYTMLSQIGVSFQKDGTLKLDSTKLQSAIDSNFNDVAALFAAVGKATDSLVSYASATEKTKVGSYPITVTQLASQGKSAGSAAAGLDIIAGTNDTLTVVLDGISANITLSPGTYGSAQALATELQSKINGTAAYVAAGASASVTESGGVLTLTSNRYGSASVARVTGGNGMANLFGTPSETLGQDVSGTINGAAAIGSGQYLTGAPGNASEGLKILVSGGSLGPRGNVNYSQGYAYQLGKLADTLLGNNAPLSSRSDGINTSLKELNRSRESWNDRLAAIEKRYRAQFTALDLTISSMQKTSSYLQQQLNNLSR